RGASCAGILAAPRDWAPARTLRQRRHRRSFVHQLIRPVRHTRETLVPNSSFLLEKMTDFGTSTVPNPVFRTEVRQFGCPRQYRAREACTAPDTFVQHARSSHSKSGQTGQFSRSLFPIDSPESWHRDCVFKRSRIGQEAFACSSFCHG